MLDVTPGAGQGATLTFGSISRSAGTTIDFQGTNLGGTTGAFAQVLFTTAPTAGAGTLKPSNIMPYATVNGSNFASYGGVSTTGGSPTTNTVAGTGVVINPSNNYVTTLPTSGGSNTTNYVITDPGTFSLTGNLAVGSLAVINDGRARGRRSSI